MAYSAQKKSARISNRGRLARQSPVLLLGSGSPLRRGYACRRRLRRVRVARTILGHTGNGARGSCGILFSAHSKN
jgi:hypothetical protein